MKVFISHSSKDSAIAKMIERTLFSQGINSYLDLYDDELVHNRGNSEITPRIVEELERCNILLAVISAATQKSWWVPFEIGIARANLLSISSYIHSNETQLPEFLLEWPRLCNENELDLYIKSIMSETYLLHETKAHFENSYNFRNNTIKYDESYKKLRTFETNIMNELKQTRGGGK